MSIAIMSAVWRRRDLTTHEKMVLLALADHANDDGICYPSIGGLAAKTAISDRGVQKIVAALVERAFLKVQIGAAKNGRNLYSINLPAEADLADPPNPVHPEPGSPRTEGAPNPVHQDPEPGSPLTPNPVRPNLHLTTNEPPPLAGAGDNQFDFDRFIAELCAAVGIAGPVPRSWSGKKARAHLTGWMTYLSPDEVIRRAAASRQQHSEAPATPQALDWFMAPNAPTPVGKPAKADREAVIRFKAEAINGERYLPADFAKSDDIKTMLDMGLVTKERLKKRGVI